MIEKKYTNEEMNIELTSFLDNKQNVWFRGKDIAKILGYRDTDDAVRRHVSAENKMIQFIRPNCWGGEKQRLNKMTLEGNIIHS